MKVQVLIAITLVAIGCNNEDVGPEGGNTVHLAGMIDNGTDGGLASYWKDGVYAALSDPTIASKTTSLYVDGTNVWIGGYKWGNPTHGVIWRNGTEIKIDNSFAGRTLIAARGDKIYAVWHDATLRWVFQKDNTTKQIIDTAYNFEPNSLALLNEDMYTSGSSVDPISPDPELGYTYQHAQTWKNGQLIFRESKVSYATSVFIYKNDIYMSGSLYDMNIPNTACYWKNGKRTDLTSESTNGIARSIFVTNDHVYAAGMINDQAVYWTDGEPTFLTNEGVNSMCHDIFIHGDDVHVVGLKNGYPAYWKNDVQQAIENQDKRGQIYFITVGSN
ncbi:MAG: hypothetical protein QM762_01805 [Chryseolinea sp.]